MQAKATTGIRNMLLDGDRYSSEPSALRPVVGVAFLAIGAAFALTAIRSDHIAHDNPWLFAAAFAAVFAARGVYLHRPITLPHLTVAVVMIAVADIAYRADHTSTGFLLIGLSGMVAVLPLRSKPNPEQICRVAALVDRSVDDSLAPFAMHSTKSYFFNESGTAAIAYRTRFGVAAVAGDPIGDRADFEQIIHEFYRFASRHGWRVGVLGAGEVCAALWRKASGDRIATVAIGRDVVIDVQEFAMVGRGFRNLRQAVQRTHNFGVTTEVVWENELSDDQRSELADIVAGKQNRGFSMILDHLLDGRHPGMQLIVARDSGGRAVGFQRYGTSGGGQEVSIDVPWRSPDAPNGIDERLAVDMIAHVQAQDGRKLSLAFAAFPELFADKDRTRVRALLYKLVHLGDPLLNLESLYRFLRKFNAFGDHRYVLLRWTQLVPVAAALLTLEFVPHRREY